tara:strand:+ start:1905 stop:2153 length:249 start_codon:yes stop_codon:yes gene_type:complete
MEMVLGLVAGVLTMGGIVPQISKAHRTKQTKDVSRGMLAIIISGVLLWTVYGFLKSDIPVTLTNFIAVLLNSYMLYLTYKFN